MLNPRLFIARRLAFCLWLGSVAAVGAWGCQGPDTFLRLPAEAGAGGARNGSGGTNVGAGGRVFGAGGTIGTGGMGTGGGGTGTGGRIGTGGAAAGGMTGSGGMIGSGGAQDGGADASATDVPTGAGGAVVDANTDVEGGVVGTGTGPCAGLCAPAVVLTVTAPNTGFTADNLGVAPTCHETTAVVNTLGCGNFTTKMLTLNGVALNCNGTFPLPSTKLNGGYCVQTSQGDFSYSWFSMYRQ